MFPHYWDGGGKGEKNAQYIDIKCKTENDWITNTAHISEIKAYVPSATNLNLEGAPAVSLNEQAWPGRRAQSSNISHPFRKNSVSKNRITSSVLVSRPLKLHCGDLEVQKKEPKQCSKH